MIVYYLLSIVNYKGYICAQMTSEDQILKLFDESQDWSPKEITFRLGISKQMVHRVLAKLLNQGDLDKFGTTPQVFYRKRQKIASPEVSVAVSAEKEEFLNKEFLLITETGEMLEGIDGFFHWCKQRNLPIEKSFDEFATTKTKYAAFYNRDGVIDGTQKLLNTQGFDKIYLDQLFYLDFYAIERFGKTRLGTLLHYAKQGQNKFLMRIMMEEIAPRIQTLISEINADAVGFAPPTLRRETQIMDFIKRSLVLSVAELNIQKISGIIPVPQKSLSKLNERINNANNTFAVFGNQKFEKVLLIDDAVGSGATLNQIAQKIKEKGISKKVIGLAVVGSFKGFDVITDI